MFVDLRERKREREKLQLAASWMCPELRMESATFRTQGNAPTNWATWPGQSLLFFKNHCTEVWLVSSRDWGSSFQGFICFGFLSNGTNHFTAGKLHPVPRSWNQDLFCFNPHLRVYLLIKRGRKAGPERKKHWSVCLMHVLGPGLNLQPFGVRDDTIINWATHSGKAVFLEKIECNYSKRD